MTSAFTILAAAIRSRARADIWRGDINPKHVPRDPTRRASSRMVAPQPQSDIEHTLSAIEFGRLDRERGERRENRVDAFL